MEHSQSSQQKQDSLSSEVATLKQSCWDLERAMAELQTTLEAKNASLAASNNDLHVAEEQYQRLMGKVEDMQRSVLSKDSMGEYLSGSLPQSLFLATLLSGGRILHPHPFTFCLGSLFTKQD